MLDALQKRQEQIDDELDKIRKLTGTESEPEPEPEADLSPEEMSEALKIRQEKIK